MPEAKHVDNAGHLEMQIGASIRACPEAQEMAASALAAWLLREQGIKADVRVCQKWPSEDWSSSGGLRHPDAVEEVPDEGRTRAARSQNDNSLGHVTNFGGLGPDTREESEILGTGLVHTSWPLD